MSADKQFTLTQGHLDLLRAMYWEWQDMETGAPAVNPKRPFGNSYVAPDIAEILGWAWPDESLDADSYDEASERVADRCMAVYRETETALEIVVGRSGWVTPPGDYVNTAEKYCRPRWELTQ